MKILITGNSGFLSKEFKDFFGKKHELTFISRSTYPSVDLLSFKDVSNFFESSGHFDFVFHTAISGGKRTSSDSLSTLTDNLLMYNNLVSNMHKYKVLFNFCSGAAFRDGNDIDSVKESEIEKRFPKDYYGMSKNIIAKDMKKYENFYNFRLFGCFGKHEDDVRFFKSILNCIKENRPIRIHQDKYMDYISAKDLCLVLDYYINNVDKLLPKDINVVYQEKKTLSQMCKTIIDLTESNPDVIMLTETQAQSYTGDGSILNSLGISMNGLDKSLLELKKHVFR
jgi:dTDP-4-dehydrorhamnose reductase